MSKLALIFPGQGAQSVGMGLDAYKADDIAKRVFDTADEVLGYALSDLIFQGPDDQLKLTYHTQPALLTTSIAYYELLRAAGIQPDYVAGHSLGEYSALVVAGVLTFEDAVRTVRLRGEFMDQAVPAGLGAMAAVLGAEREALASLCAAITKDIGVVELANVNCPGQIVVSGSSEGVQAVVDQGKGIGAKRVIPLVVSGPFHSSMMKPASVKLGEVLNGLTFNDAAFPVIANVTAEPVVQSGLIRDLLVQQVYSPVLWEDCVNRMIADGVDTFLEVGSGSVLTGLIKKINKDVRCHTLDSVEAVKLWLELMPTK
ncbi:MAG: ACP S-malonyltransferase [Paenibacillaceae bacterium]